MPDAFPRKITFFTSSPICLSIFGESKPSEKREPVFTYFSDMPITGIFSLKEKRYVFSMAVCEIRFFSGSSSSASILFRSPIRQEDDIHITDASKKRV